MVSLYKVTVHRGTTYIFVTMFLGVILNLSLFFCSQERTVNLNYEVIRVCWYSIIALSALSY